MSGRVSRSTRRKATESDANTTLRSRKKTSTRSEADFNSNAEAAASEAGGAVGDDNESLDSEALDDDIPKRRATRSRDVQKNKERSVSKRKSAGSAKKLRSRELSGHSDDDAVSLDSDALDDDEPPTRKRKRASSSKGKAKAASPKKRKKADSDEDAPNDWDDLEDDQEVVGVVVQAPKTGRVPPGQISQNTLNFLLQLTKPECNDREWFKLHEPVYRLAEKEWKDFIESFTDILVESDPQIPHLPPKDVTHRIYRDVRFSNDKTPYKTGFSASFSRSGRKGIFAHCMWFTSIPYACPDPGNAKITFRPGGQSIIAAGSWHPAKNELDTIRSNLRRSSTRLRTIISDPQFEGLFGEAKPHPEGRHQNIFGMDDQLKVAPKGVSKDHKDIDLLKCRSFAVVHRFTDKQVLQPDFKEELGKLVTIMRPFVHCLNDLMTIPDAGSGSENEGDSGDEED